MTETRQQETLSSEIPQTIPGAPTAEPVPTMRRENTTSNIETPVEVFRRVGGMKYHLKVHFKPDAKETLQNKLEHLLTNEVRNSELTFSDSTIPAHA